MLEQAGIATSSSSGVTSLVAALPDAAAAQARSAHTSLSGAAAGAAPTTTSPNPAARQASNAMGSAFATSAAMANLAGLVPDAHVTHIETAPSLAHAPLPSVIASVSSQERSSPVADQLRQLMPEVNMQPGLSSQYTAASSGAASSGAASVQQPGARLAAGSSAGGVPNGVSHPKHPTHHHRASFSSQSSGGTASPLAQFAAQTAAQQIQGLNTPYAMPGQPLPLQPPYQTHLPQQHQPSPLGYMGAVQQPVGLVSSQYGAAGLSAAPVGSASYGAALQGTVAGGYLPSAAAPNGTPGVWPTLQPAMGSNAIPYSPQLTGGHHPSPPQQPMLAGQRLANGVQRTGMAGGKGAGRGGAKLGEVPANPGANTPQPKTDEPFADLSPFHGASSVPTTAIPLHHSSSSGALRDTLTKPHSVPSLQVPVVSSGQPGSGDAQSDETSSQPAGSDANSPTRAAAGRAGAGGRQQTTSTPNAWQQWGADGVVAAAQRPTSLYVPAIANLGLAGPTAAGPSFMANGVHPLPFAQPGIGVQGVWAAPGLAVAGFGGPAAGNALQPGLPVAGGPLGPAGPNPGALTHVASGRATNTSLAGQLMDIQVS